MNSTLALISGLGLETSGLGLEAFGLGLETPGLVNIPAPGPGRGSEAGRKFLAPPYNIQRGARSVLASL